MGGILYERHRPKDESVDAWHAIVHSTPTDVSDRIDVIVPDFDPGFVWKNCRWQARDAVSLPAPGDECLVMLSNRSEPWVISWWPEGFP